MLSAGSGDFRGSRAAACSINASDPDVSGVRVANSSATRPSVLRVPFRPAFADRRVVVALPLAGRAFAVAGTAELTAHWTVAIARTAELSAHWTFAIAAGRTVGFGTGAFAVGSRAVSKHRPRPIAELRSRTVAELRTRAVAEVRAQLVAGQPAVPVPVQRLQRGSGPFDLLGREFAVLVEIDGLHQGGTKLGARSIGTALAVARALLFTTLFPTRAIRVSTPLCAAVPFSLALPVLFPHSFPFRFSAPSFFACAFAVALPFSLALRRTAATFLARGLPVSPTAFFPLSGGTIAPFLFCGLIVRQAGRPPHGGPSQYQPHRQPAHS